MHSKTFIFKKVPTIWAILEFGITAEGINQSINFIPEM